MNIRYSFIFLVCIVFSVTLARAQSYTGRIAYGETIASEITDDAYELQYVFESKAGDALVFIMGEAERYSQFSEPEITVRNSSWEIVGTTYETVSDFGVYSRKAYLPIVLSADGNYTVVVGRRGGEGGKSVGRFDLELRVPLRLEPGTIVSNVISNQDDFHFYAYQGEQNMIIAYNKLEGDYWPHIRVNIIDEDRQAFMGIGHLAGDQLTMGTLGVYPIGPTYFITVGQPAVEVTNEMAFIDVFARYTLELIGQD